MVAARVPVTIWKEYAFKTDVKNQCGAVAYEIGSTLLQTTPLWVDCDLGCHAPKCESCLVEWWQGQRISVEPHGLLQVSNHGPLSQNSIRKSNWQTSCGWRKESSRLSWAGVHVKARSVLVLLQSRENASEILKSVLILKTSLLIHSYGIAPFPQLPFSSSDGAWILWRQWVSFQPACWCRQNRGLWIWGKIIFTPLHISS